MSERGTAVRATWAAAVALLLSGCSTGPECGECLRAITCVKSCGGPAVTSGCCPCPAGTFDDIQCRKETGTDARECEKNPCFRAYECVTSCGGPLVYSGCCPCTSGTLDRVIQCREASVGDKSGSPSH